MNEWTNGSLINEAAIEALTPDQLIRLAQILEKIR